MAVIGIPPFRTDLSGADTILGYSNMWIIYQETIEYVIVQKYQLFTVGQELISMSYGKNIISTFGNLC